MVGTHPEKLRWSTPPGHQTWDPPLLTSGGKPEPPPGMTYGGGHWSMYSMQTVILLECFLVGDGNVFSGGCLSFCLAVTTKNHIFTLIQTFKFRFYDTSDQYFWVRIRSIISICYLYMSDLCTTARAPSPRTRPHRQRHLVWHVQAINLSCRCLIFEVCALTM